MIKYLQYENKYYTQVNNLIKNIMTNELKINIDIIVKTTSDLKNINEYYINNEGNFWLAIDNKTNEVVGTVGILKLDKVNAEFKRFYVLKEYRNRSIGYELYRISEKFAKDKGFKYLYLASGKDLKKAHRIYNKNGWEVIDKNSCELKIFVRDEAKIFKKKL